MTPNLSENLQKPPFIIVDRLHEPEIAQILWLLRYLSYNWSAKRPAMNVANNDLSKTVSLMNGEALEASDAQHAYETAIGLSTPESLQSLLMELFDIAVFVFSLFEHSGMPFDGARVVGNVNGTGRASGVYEKILTYGRNIDLQELPSFDILHQILIDVLSAVNNLQSSGVFAQVIIQAMAKNMRNYPARFFSDRDPLNPNRVLRLDELLQRYQHAVTALRLIRGVHGDSIRGLAPQSVTPYQELIQNYQDSQQALARLKILLEPTP